MNKCKNCKHFKRYTDERYSNKYGKCDCNKFQYDISKKKETETDKLYYMDYEWYNADIEVGENFGCIHFKQREGGNYENKNSKNIIM